MWPWLAIALAMALTCAGCSEPESEAPAVPSDAGAPDISLATHWLSVGAALPTRAEVVALADRLSIAAEKAKAEPATALRLTWLAARLRERLWRFDRAQADVLEAVELYGIVVRAAVGEARSCQADLRRATLNGEFAADASATYHGLYTALKRQESTSGAAPDRRACLAEMTSTLRALEAFRPRGSAWQKLTAEADRQASAQRDRSLGAPTTPPRAAKPAVEMLADQPDVVVVPDAKMVSPDGADLESVAPYSWELGGRVVLTLSAPIRYEVGVLPPNPGAKRGHRVFVDLVGARMNKPMKELEADGLIDRVRLGRRRDGTRVVLDLTGAAFRRVFFLPDPFRVVIDLSTRAPTPVAPTTRGGKRDVRRVALDPGHGGFDTGAIGPTGLREKDVVLDIAHRAAPALASELGIETMLTRDMDAFIPLEERTARANAYHADLFISIHCNATENGEAEGVEIFMLDPSREMDAWALRAATRENVVFHKGAPGGRTPALDARRLDAQVAQVAAGLQVADVTARSNLLAGLLGRTTMSSLTPRYPETHDHGIKTAGFFVLLGAEMPAVLYETAFISNSNDESRLATADYRQKLADAIVNAVRAYRDGLK